MCQAKVLLQKGDKSELFLEDVIYLKVEGDKVWLSTFFEDPIVVHASIKEADFLKHTVTLEAFSGQESE